MRALALVLSMLAAAHMASKGYDLAERFVDAKIANDTRIAIGTEQWAAEARLERVALDRIAAALEGRPRKARVAEVVDGDVKILNGNPLVHDEPMMLPTLPTLGGITR